MVLNLNIKLYRNLTSLQFPIYHRQRCLLPSTTFPIFKKCMVASGNPNLSWHLFLQGRYILSVCLSVLCVQVYGSHFNIECLFQSLSICFLSSFSLNLELTNLVRLPCQQAPGTLLPLPPQWWDDRHEATAGLFFFFFKVDSGASAQILIFAWQALYWRNHLISPSFL